MADDGGLAGFSISREELAEATMELRQNKGALRDGRICVCGHPMSRHTEWEGRVSCTPTRMACPCHDSVAVIDVDDTRPFLRKTKGTGPMHALMQGLSGLIEKDRPWRWVDGFPLCMKCGVEGVSVLPFAINRFGRASWEPEKRNVLLCETCATEVSRVGVAGSGSEVTG